MADFDLFNGDADGIFSLLQLRQIEPRPDAELVTGVKRDIRLFARIADRVQAGDRVTALDISMAKNTGALVHVLEAGAEVFYVDHYQTGEVPYSDRLTLISDMSSATCTACLVNGHLGGAKAQWAVCGAYGDNFPEVAERIVADAGLDLPMARLRELGELVNYNAYGLAPDDLFYHPADLYRTLLAYPGPVEFLDDGHDAIGTLQAGHADDWVVARRARVMDRSEAGRVLVLPATPASNRISGVFGNALVSEEPESAFAILTEVAGDAPAYRVSIRAPRTRKAGSAADLAVRFGGGGRAAAAGIDLLAGDDVIRFVDDFRSAFA